MCHDTNHYYTPRYMQDLLHVDAHQEILYADGLLNKFDRDRDSNLSILKIQAIFKEKTMRTILELKMYVSFLER